MHFLYMFCTSFCRHCFSVKFVVKISFIFARWHIFICTCFSSKAAIGFHEHMQDALRRPKAAESTLLCRFPQGARKVPTRCQQLPSIFAVVYHLGPTSDFQRRRSSRFAMCICDWVFSIFDVGVAETAEDRYRGCRRPPKTVIEAVVVVCGILSCHSGLPASLLHGGEFGFN